MINNDLITDTNIPTIHLLHGEMKLTRRGKQVRGVAIVLGIVALYFVATHINWVGDGWCFGSITACYKGAY